MKPVRVFNVIPSLPEPLEPLRDLAYNLRWAWDHDSIELFRRLDTDLWESTGHNPVLMLGSIDQMRLVSAAGDDSWRRRDDFNGSDCSHRQSGDFRTWSRPCGMAGLGSASIDDRRQTTPHGDQQARQQVPAQAADPWSTSGTAPYCGKGHGTWPMGEESAQPRPSECRGRCACQ